MAIDFPASPSNNDLFVANGVTYIYDSAKSYWRVSTAADSGNSLTLANLTVTSTLVSSGLNYPTADGTNGQAIITDGAGNLSFSTIAGGSSITDTLDLTDSSGNSTIVRIQSTGNTTNSQLVISNYQSETLTNALTISETGQVTATSFAGNGANLTNINYTVTQNDVTQHQAALSITESQISDLQNYLTAEVDTLDTVTSRGATTSNNLVVGALGASGTVTGLNLATLSYAQFPNNVANPSYQEGRVFYDQTNKALSYYNDEAEVTLQIGQEQFIRVYNNSGSTIANGAPVYISGQVSGTPTIALSDAVDEIRATAIGLATHAIENATFGYVTVQGVVRGVNTSALTAGARTHVSPTAGVLQTAAPTYPYYATDIGICLVSHATLGEIYVTVQSQHAETFRTSGNAAFDGNVRIGGDLTILGTQSTIQVSTIRVDDNIIYLNGGNAVAQEDITFTGSGLNDMIFNGYYEGNDAGTTYYVRIDGVGTGTGGVDTFEWSIDNFSTTEATGVDITGSDQVLSNNIRANFNATTGHTLNDTWSATALPSNVDIGFMGNRNTGASGPGYSHVGFFFDTADARFKAFREYGPDPIGGNINASDPSFVLGDIQAATFIGNVTGDVTGNVSGTAGSLATGRTFTLTGAVTGTGNVAFDGTANITINTSLAATYLTDITGENLGDLSNVTITTPSTGDVLSYNGTQWVNSSAIATTLASHTIALAPLSRQTDTTDIVAISVGTTAPSSPAVGDLWVDTN